MRFPSQRQQDLVNGAVGKRLLQNRRVNKNSARYFRRALFFKGKLFQHYRVDNILCFGLRLLLIVRRQRNLQGQQFAVNFRQQH